MSETTPKNRLSDTVNAAFACSTSLSHFSVVCNAINSDDHDDVTCAFSDILNSLYGVIKLFKNCINSLNRKLNLMTDIDDGTIIAITDKRGCLQKVYNQLEDFTCLMDCTIETSDSNPRVFAGYFSNRIKQFSTEIFNNATQIERLAA